MESKIRILFISLYIALFGKLILNKPDLSDALIFIALTGLIAFNEFKAKQQELKDLHSKIDHIQESFKIRLQDLSSQILKHEEKFANVQTNVAKVQLAQGMTTRNVKI